MPRRSGTRAASLPGRAMSRRHREALEIKRADPEHRVRVRHARRGQP